MKRRLFYLMVLCALAIQSCTAVNRCPQGDICDMAFQNNSNAYVYVGSSYDLPDTSLASMKMFTAAIKPNNSYSLGSGGWKQRINKYCPSGKIMFVVTNKDTIDRYGIDDVILNYRIEKRYELSIDSLEKLHWTITYP